MKKAGAICLALALSAAFVPEAEAQHGWGWGWSASLETQAPEPLFPLQFAAGDTGDFQIMWYGQSLTLGTNSGSAYSTTQPFDSLDGSGLAALVETGVERPVSPACNHLANGETPGDRVYICASKGVSGADYAQLNTDPEWSSMTGVIDTVEATRGGAQKVFAMVVMHGTAEAIDDCDGAGCTGVYRAQLKSWQDRITNHAKATTGQQRPVFLLVDQVSSWSNNSGVETVVLEQIAAAREDPYIFLVGPRYHAGDWNKSIFSADGVHPGYDRLNDNEGYRLLGNYQGMVLKEIGATGTWQPLWITGANSVGTTLTVDYHSPCQTMGTCSGNPLVFETSDINPADSSGDSTHGFDIYCPGMVNPPVMAAVPTVSGTQVTITTDKAIPNTGCFVEYGMDCYATADGGNGHASGDYGSCRGNLADTNNLVGYSISEWLINYAVHERYAINGDGGAAASSVATVLDDKVWTALYKADSSWPGASCTAALDWTASVGGVDLTHAVGTYTCDNSTDDATSAGIGASAIDEAIQTTGATSRWSVTNALLDKGTNEDLLVRYVGDCTRVGSNAYPIFWGNAFTANNHAYLYFLTNGNISTVIQTAGSNLTWARAAIMPASGPDWCVIDVYWDMQDQSGNLRVHICVDGDCDSSSIAGAGGALGGEQFSLTGAYNSSSPFKNAFTGWGIAVGWDARWWSEAQHIADAAAF